MFSLLQNGPVAVVLFVLGLSLVAICFVRDPKFFGGTLEAPTSLKRLAIVIGVCLMLAGAFGLSESLGRSEKDETHLPDLSGASTPSPAPTIEVGDAKAASLNPTIVGPVVVPTVGAKRMPKAAPAAKGAPVAVTAPRQQVVGGDACLSPNGDVNVGGNLEISDCNAEAKK